jgi:glycosyltransferase involved in cell wall biosynthesis
MIIGIDYTAAAWQGAGIGRHTRGLVRAAAERARQHQFRLFFPARGLPPDSPYIADLRDLCRRHPHVRAVPIPLTPRALTRLWQRLRLPLPIELLAGRLDVLHAPDFVLPPTRARTLLTVHDLSFLVGPEWFEPALQRYLARVVPRMVRRADLVLADSLATRDDLVRLLGVDARRVAVVYPTRPDERFAPMPPAATEPVRERLGLPRDFFFFVSTLEPRKNLVRTIEAFGLLLEGVHGTVPPGLELVIAGRKGWLYEEIFRAAERPAVRGRVRFLDFLRDSDLPAVYNLARALVYATLYEGFGIPPLEAMACGTPVVASNVASLPEAVGDAAILADPRSANSIAAGMTRALDPNATAPLREAGLAQVAQFTTQRAANALLECYEQVIR